MRCAHAHTQMLFQGLSWSASGFQVMSLVFAVAMFQTKKSLRQSHAHCISGLYPPGFKQSKMTCEATETTTPN